MQAEHKGAGRAQGNREQRVAELALGSSRRDAEGMAGTSKGDGVGHQRPGLCTPADG